jgi:hypothetical protein
MEEFLTEEDLDIYIGIILSVFSIRINDIAERISLIQKPFVLASSYKDLDSILSPKLIIKSIIDNQKIIYKDDNKLIINSPLFNKTMEFIEGSFIITMKEKMEKTQTYIKQENNIVIDPMVQFLRHLRNYFGHNGRFDIRLKEKETFKEAKWRDKEITLEMDDKCMVENFMKPGDYLLLLIDINDKFYKPVSILKN